MKTSTDAAASSSDDVDHPLVYEVNTRVLLRELSDAAGQRVTLDRIPDRLLDGWARLGFDAVWLMGVWTTGKIGLAIAAAAEDLAKEYLGGPSRLQPCRDVIGSPYAVKAYTVAGGVGGREGAAGSPPPAGDVGGSG